MRVAQIIDRIRLVGGAERLQTTLAEEMEHRDIDLSVLTLHENDSEAERRIRELGVEVHAFPAKRFWSPRRLLRLAAYMRERRFDVVHSHLVRSTMLGLPVARACGSATVATLHNTDPRRGRHFAIEPTEAWVLRERTDRVVACGWETARFHQERLGLRGIEVIPNAVGRPARLAAGERAAIRKDLGVAPGEGLLLAVGRLHANKAHRHLLEAMTSLVRRHVPVQLRIAGSGSLGTQTRSTIESMRLGEHVRLLGARDDVPRLMAASDLYVSSSISEGLPVAMLEAMATGLPPVVTAVGDVARVLEGGLGRVVPAGDVQALAVALEAGLADAAWRRKEAQRVQERVRERFSARHFGDRHMELYQSLCAATRGPGAGPNASAPEAGGSPCGS